MRHTYERKILPKSPAVLTEPDVAKERDGQRSMIYERCALIVRANWFGLNLVAGMIYIRPLQPLS